MNAVEAPAGRQDQPEALAHLDDVLELARREEPAWPAQQRELRRSGALLNEVSTEADAGKEGEEPTTEGDHSAEAEPGTEGAESFTDFDLDSLPPEARAAAEAAEKRMQADYTRKTQEASQRVTQAEQYQAIVEGLEDPQRAPEILRILGWDLEDGAQEEFAEEEFETRDPRVDQLEQRLAERERMDEIKAEEQAEDRSIAEQIEASENEMDHKFSEEEIGFLYLYADEYRDEQGKPNVKAAIDLLEGIVSSRQQNWIETKKAPRRLRQGKPATREVDLSTESREDRIKRMAEAAEAVRGSAE
jgi:hypothetical protein